MKSINYILTILLLAAILGLLFWISDFPGPAANPAKPRLATASERSVPPIVLRLGLVPERDLFLQRAAYRKLALYLESHIHLPLPNSTLASPSPLHVELVTVSTYAGVLKDFEENKVDAAFLGSLVSLLSVDRQHTQILLKSHQAGGAATYAGVIFVKPDSPITTLADLRGKKLGGVRTTTAGAVFPVFLLHKNNLVGPDAPQLVWSGTHDDVIAEVLAGRLDAGAVKDPRLNAWERAHPESPAFRRIAASERVPDNALVVRGDLSADLRDAVLNTLLAMDKDPAAADALKSLGLQSFDPCDPREYEPLYAMIQSLGPAWAETQIEGPAPLRPYRAATTSAPASQEVR